MPKRQMTSTDGPTKKKRKVARRYFRFRRRPVQNNVVTATFTRAAEIRGDAGSNTFHAEAFSIAEITGPSGYLSLYDEYKFDRITVRVIPRQNSGVLLTQGTTNYNSENGGYYVHAVDYDDGTTWTTIDQALNHHGRKIVSLLKESKVTFVPHFSKLLFESSSASGYSNERAGWIDNVSTAVQHFGWKMMVHQGGASTEGDTVFDVFYVTTISFRKKI